MTSPATTVPVARRVRPIRRVRTRQQPSGQAAPQIVPVTADPSRLRRLAREVDADLQDLQRTFVRIGERSNWTDARLDTIDADLRGLEAHYRALLDAARALDDQQQGHETAVSA